MTDTLAATKNMRWQPSPAEVYRVALIDGGQAGDVRRDWFGPVLHGASVRFTHLVIKSNGDPVEIQVGQSGGSKGARGSPSIITGGFEVLEQEVVVKLGFDAFSK